MTDAILSAEAYGIKSTATDMIRFVKANLNMIPLDAKLQRESPAPTPVTSRSAR